MGMFSKFVGGVVGLGGQIGAGIGKAFDKLANKQEFDACIGACVVMASADGVISADERKAAVTFLASHPQLESFGAADVKRQFEADVSLLGADRDMGIEMLLDRIKNLRTPEAKSRVTMLSLQIAAADGNVDDSEKAMIARIKAL